MKAIIIACFLLPTILYGQNSTLKPFLKVAPTAYLPEKQNGAMGITTSVGYKGRFLAAGLALGGYKLHDFDDGVYLLGSEVIATDFNSNKIRPILIIGLYRPFYRDEYNYWEGSNNIEVNTNAKIHFESSLGISIPVMSKKIFISGGFSLLGFKNTITTSNGITKLHKNERSSLKMGTVSIGLFL
jgi:hypothetical protein